LHLGFRALKPKDDILMEEGRTCGSDDQRAMALKSNPEYKRKRAEIEKQTANFVEAARKKRDVGLIVPSDVKIIWVVVHIIYNAQDPASNITDEQVHSQIDALNRDYRMKNADAEKTPWIHRQVAGDACIEFRLAPINHLGLATKGITRTFTKQKHFWAGNDMKHGSFNKPETGGWDAWDTTRYLNIWVCPNILKKVGWFGFTGPVLGFGTQPESERNPADDGLAIIHSAFGTTGTAKAPFNLGRTAVHEVGHWLNLEHPWGAEETNWDDYVDDTPPKEGPHFGTPNWANETVGYMFMNYMDYVDDEAMFMFTAGQVQRMHATLAGPRTGAVRETTYRNVPPGEITG
jgi:hypothetical protein